MKTALFLVIALITAVTAKAVEVKVCQTEKAKYAYRIELANLILSKSAFQYGPAQIAPFSLEDPSQDRCIVLLKGNDVDVVYLPATKKRLKEMDAIKIDIHNGMLGYRVFIINKEDKKKFAKVKTLKDLRKFEGGFGIQWGDFKVFTLNKLPVQGIIRTSSLLLMLDHHRFDYFHRGLHEAWAEVEANKEKLPNLMVEETLALVYDFPVYFMFNKENQALKKRFEKGLKIILEDNSFRQLYTKRFGNYAKKANLKNRTIIPIKYPTPEGLPPIDTSLWLN